MNVDNSPVLPVGIICGYVKRIFESEELLHNITVLGEVSNFKTTGGYAYFNLKDSDGLLPCVCFGLYKTQIPKDGDKVFVSGSISFYQKGGKVSFIVDKISYTGKGELLLFYQELKEKLQKEGIFDESHKKDIPLFPKSVCVVTSKNGAAVQDVIKTIRNKNDIIDISVVDVKVQGEDAPNEIVKGISTADKSGADVIILARGGGSYEDLLSFCDEKVVRAVYNANTPIISAVGHETDVTLVDFASDLRVATPTAAGEYVAWSKQEIKNHVFTLITSVYRNSKRIIDNGQKEVISAVNNLSYVASLYYEKSKSRFSNALLRAINGVKDNLNNATLKTNLLIKRIESSNPISTLRKGLYKVYLDDKPLTNADKLKTGDKIELKSPDVNINATVDLITVKGKGEQK